MSVSSVDASKLDAAIQFVGFLELIRNPENLKTTLTDLQALVAQNKKLIEAKTKIENVDSYVQNERTKVDTEAKKFKAEQDSHAQAVAAHIAAEAEFAKYKADVDSKHQLAAKNLDAKSSSLMQYEQKLISQDKDQQQRQKLIDQRKIELDAQQADLDAKATKLKSLLGV